MAAAACVPAPSQAVPSYLRPPAGALVQRREELGLQWYTNADPARQAAQRFTSETGELHFVVALDHGTERWRDGTLRREAIVDGDGALKGSKMFLPFTFPTLAAFMDAVRLSPAYGPSCLNMYEEVNVDRTRRIGFDLEFELDHARKNGARDHEARAAALWPAECRRDGGWHCRRLSLHD